MTQMLNRFVPRVVAGAIALHETHLEDQLAALAYLKQLPDVDAQRIAVAGCSYGGIQTVLAVEANAEQKLGLRAAIDFAGGAESWRSLSLRDRMIRAIRKADIPVLFIQAENDYDLGPSRTLAGELEQLGKPHKLLIFPPYRKYSRRRTWSVLLPSHKRLGIRGYCLSRSRDGER